MVGQSLPQAADLARKRQHGIVLNIETGVHMSTEILTRPTSKVWKELYTAALFEADKSKVSERIANSE